MSGDEKIAGHIGQEPYGALDPARDLERWERVVEGIVTAAQPELARRSRTGEASMAQVLGRWQKAGVVAAGVVAAAASVALLFAGQPVAEAEAAVVYPAEALMYDMGDWLMTGEAPSMTALLTEFGDAS